MKKVSYWCFGLAVVVKSNWVNPACYLCPCTGSPARWLSAAGESEVVLGVSETSCKQPQASLSMRGAPYPGNAGIQVLIYACKQNNGQNTCMCCNVFHDHEYPKIESQNLCPGIICRFPEPAVCIITRKIFRTLGRQPSQLSGRSLPLPLQPSSAYA